MSDPERDAQLEPVHAVRFDVTGWSVPEEHLQDARAALRNRRWPWVQLRHMDHDTGQEARIVEVEDGYRLRFRRRHLPVTVTVLPGEVEGIAVGWHAIADTVDLGKDLEKLAERVRRGSSEPAVILACAGCGEVRRRGVTGIVLESIEIWGRLGGRGPVQANLVPGHRRSRDPEKIRARVLRQERRRTS